MVRALIMAAKATLTLITGGANRVAAPTYELAGVVCAGIATATLWRPAGVWAVAAVALLGKSLERDLNRDGNRE